MAGRSGKLTGRWPGLAASALLAALCLGALAAVMAAQDLRIAASDWAAVQFTVVQAGLSAALSVLAAIPLARALARRAVPFRGALILLMGAPFILPVVIAVMGMIAVFGRNGWISALFGALGLPTPDIYGLHGVVLAHVFFNLPLATRLILQGWAAVPGEQMRLAVILGFRARDVRRHVELPMLSRVLPGALALIFLICTTSFAVALILGGGPGATTVELAIYQAFRFEFDLGHAAGLAVVQVVIGLGAAFLAYWFRGSTHVQGGLDRVMGLRVPGRRWMAVLDYAVILMAALFLLAPLAAIVMAGLGGLADLTGSVLPAIARSLAVSLAAVVIALSLALPMAALAVRGAGAMAEGLAYLMLAISPLVIGTGLFLILYRFVDPVDWALGVTALVNAALALPFALQAVLPALRQIEADFGRLAENLGLTGWARWRVLILPRLRRPLGFAAGLTAALSAGDLGVIALFADPSRPTLPLYVYQLMGSYRSDAAWGAALILMGLSLGLFWMFDRGGRGNAAA